VRLRSTGLIAAAGCGCALLGLAACGRAAAPRTPAGERDGGVRPAARVPADLADAGTLPRRSPERVAVRPDELPPGLTARRLYAGYELLKHGPRIVPRAGAGSRAGAAAFEFAIFSRDSRRRVYRLLDLSTGRPDGYDVARVAALDLAVAVSATWRMIEVFSRRSDSAASWRSVTYCLHDGRYVFCGARDPAPPPPPSAWRHAPR
jgi:hypothetical protein